MIFYIWKIKFYLENIVDGEFSYKTNILIREENFTNRLEVKRKRHNFTKDWKGIVSQESLDSLGNFGLD